MDMLINTIFIFLCLVKYNMLNLELTNNKLIEIEALHDVVLPKDTYLFRVRTNINDPNMSNDNAAFRFFIYLQKGQVSKWCDININKLWTNKAVINNSSIQLFQLLKDIKLYKLSTNSYTFDDVTQHDKNSINRLLNFINTNLKNQDYYNKIKLQMLEGNRLISNTSIKANYDLLVNNQNQLIAALNYSLLEIYNATELSEYAQIVNNYTKHGVINIVANPDLLLAAFFEAADINGWVRVGEIGQPNNYDEVMLTSKIFNDKSNVKQLAEILKTTDASFFDICKNVVQIFEQPNAKFIDTQVDMMPYNLEGGCGCDASIGKNIYYKKYLKYKKKYFNSKL